MEDGSFDKSQLHDELLESRGERLLDKFLALPSVLRAVVGCGTLLVAFLLGAVAWGLLLEFIFN